MIRVLMVAVFGLSGCLGSHYEVPTKTLERLAEMAPEQRGEKVRVIQQFGTGPQEAVHVACNGCAPRHGHPHGTSHGHANITTGGGGSSSSGSRGGGGGGGLAGAKIDSAAILVVAAGVLAVYLASQEGLRYDGWSKLRPSHTIHLYGRDGEYRQVALADLTVNDAQWARRAYVRERDGSMSMIARAPLDRTGLAFTYTLGTSELGSVFGGEVLGFQNHITLGYFPVSEIGIQANFSLGWGSNSLEDPVFESRYGGELHWMPLKLGRLHAGGFGGLGYANRFEDGPKGTDRSGRVLSVGGIVQIDLATRLALTGRAASSYVFGGVTTDFTVGLSIY